MTIYMYDMLMGHVGVYGYLLKHCSSLLLANRFAKLGRLVGQLVVIRTGVHCTGQSIQNYGLQLKVHMIIL